MGSQRAAIGKMAVSSYYFDHGPASDGCLWYAQTPDGDVLVRNASDEYSSHNYKIRAIGGLVFYTDKNGNVGQCDDIAEETDDGANYSENEIDIEKPVDKYLLADNGIIYECKLDGVTADLIVASLLKMALVMTLKSGLFLTTNPPKINTGN